MKRTCNHLTWALVVLAGAASGAAARDIYVATNGLNAPGRGGPDDPYRTILYANQQAANGDVIHVREGTYNESRIQIRSGVRIVSADGLHKARVNAGGSTSFRFENGCQDAEVDGFEVYSIWSGGSGFYDGLVRVWNCNNIRIRNMLIHDAPRDADCIKIGGAGAVTTNILIENCVVYNPAYRNDGPAYQECIDIYPADGVTVRGCWLYHTVERGGDYLMYAKGGSSNILWENNIFGPAQSSPSGNASTSAGGPSPAVFPSCENFIARNNLFLECSGDGAFGLLSARNVEFYNNIIWGYKGSRAAIEFWASLVGGPRNENFQCYNNIFMNQTAPIYSDRGYAPLAFAHDFNLYWQVGGGGSVNINAEPNSLFVDPRLEAPSSPDQTNDTWASIVDRFALRADSPAVNEGLDLGALVAGDIRGRPRPIGSGYDIGAHEFTHPGDLDFDGEVTVLDIVTVVVAFGTVPGDAGWVPAADLDRDGEISVLDIVTTVSNFGKTVP